MATEDAEDDAFTLELAQLQVPRHERDEDWVKRRRELHGRRSEAVENRKAIDNEEQLRLAKDIRAKMARWEGHEGPVDAVDLAEFTQRALVLLRSKEPEEQQEQRFPAKEEIGVKGETAVSSQGGGEGHNARDLYAAYFFQTLSEPRAMEATERPIASFHTSLSTNSGATISGPNAFCWSAASSQAQQAPRWRTRMAGSPSTMPFNPRSIGVMASRRAGGSSP